MNPTTPPEPQVGATPEANASLVHELRSYAHPSCFSRDEFAYAHQRAIEQVSALESALASSRAETEEAKARADKWESRMYAARHKARVALHFPRGHVCDFRNACQSFMDLSASLEPMEQRVATLTATLAQREAEAAAIRSFLQVPEYGDPMLALKTREELAMQAVSARDTALARVRELEKQAAMRNKVFLNGMELARKEVDSALSFLPKEYVIQHEDPYAAMALTFAKLNHAIAAARAVGTGEEGAGV